MIPHAGTGRVHSRVDGYANTPDVNRPVGRQTAATVAAIDTLAAILAVNRAYYEAFENRDMDAMSDLWEHSERVLCTHPGWVTLHGWAEVAGSFFAFFNNAAPIQFILTNEQVHMQGEVAWVAVDENILGEQSGATVSALNVFADVDGDGDWRFVCHQASLVSPPTDDLIDEE